MYEADLERLRQERAQAGQQFNEVAGQKRTVAPLQRALTKAETDAEIAKRKLARAQQQPNTTGRVLQNVGAGTAKMGALPRVVWVQALDTLA
jgi:predicted RNase H-like nuclease (RuvC/YqgF family)